MVLKLFATVTVVAKHEASPKLESFTWSYRFSIYGVHWEKTFFTITDKRSLTIADCVP